MHHGFVPQNYLTPTELPDIGRKSTALPGKKTRFACLKKKKVGPLVGCFKGKPKGRLPGGVGRLWDTPSAHRWFPTRSASGGTGTELYFRTLRREVSNFPRCQRRLGTMWHQTWVPPTHWYMEPNTKKQISCGHRV